MLCHRLFAAQGPHTPFAGRARIGQGLKRRECLGRNDEERLSRVKVACCFHELVAVNVGDEAHGQAAITEVLQRIVGHGGTEIRAANPYINDIAHTLAGVPRPRTAANPVREVSHLIKHSMDHRHHVLAINND